MLRFCGLLLALVMSSLHAAEAPVEVAGAMTVNSAQAKRLHELGAVRSEHGDEHGWRLQVDIALADAQRLFAQPHGEPLRALLEAAGAPT